MYAKQKKNSKKGIKVTTASEDAGVTSTTETDADKAVREAEESLAAAKAVQADEAANPTTPAPDAANGDTSTTSSTTTDAGSQDSGATTEGATDDVPTYPSVAELGAASATLRAGNETRVAAFLDQIGEQLMVQGIPEGGPITAPEDPTAQTTS